MIPISSLVSPLLYLFISISRMVSSINEMYQTLEELMLILDSSMIAVYLDVNSDRSLAILRKYLISAVIPIMGIAEVMGKAKEEVSLDNSMSINILIVCDRKTEDVCPVSSDTMQF